MKKVYVVTDGERIFMTCKNKSDAEDLVKLWGRDYAYSFIEVPYMDAEAPSWFPCEGTPKSPDVEPMLRRFESPTQTMPFIGKPPTTTTRVI